jgi:hypothetical protein
LIIFTRGIPRLILRKKIGNGSHFLLRSRAAEAAARIGKCCKKAH